MMQPLHRPAPCRTSADIVLQPGDWYFGEGDTRIRTLLGTCVSIVLWHPVLHMGGMCHYMLPGRSPHSGGKLDGRYAEDAFRLMQIEILARGTPASDYVLKLVGGGNMFPGAHCHRSGAPHVGTRNADAARNLAQRHGLQCVYEHLEGVGHRDVVFDVRDGRVLVRQLVPARARPASARGVISCAA